VVEGAIAETWAITKIGQRVNGDPATGRDEGSHLEGLGGRELDPFGVVASEPWMPAHGRGHRLTGGDLCPGVEMSIAQDQALADEASGRPIRWTDPAAQNDLRLSRLFDLPGPIEHQAVKRVMPVGQWQPMSHPVPLENAALDTSDPRRHDEATPTEGTVLRVWRTDEKFSPVDA
jgi:hypothetical protein